MNIRISTKVSQSYTSVMQGFNEQLFLRLNPPFPPVKLVRFDGCKKNDIVSLELNFILFKQKWVSQILEDHLNETKFYFIDFGTKLPFFLKYWKHQHRILKYNNEAVIVDDIHFKTPFFLLDFLLYPVLYLQFLYRKPIYKKVFAD